MKYDVQFFDGDFLQARTHPFTWGPGDTGESDPRFSVVLGVDFEKDTSQTVNGVSLVWNGDDVREAD